MAKSLLNIEMAPELHDCKIGGVNARQSNVWRALQLTLQAHEGGPDNVSRKLPQQRGLHKLRRVRAAFQKAMSLGLPDNVALKDSHEAAKEG